MNKCLFRTIAVIMSVLLAFDFGAVYSFASEFDVEDYTEAIESVPDNKNDSFPNLNEQEYGLFYEVILDANGGYFPDEGNENLNISERCEILTVTVNAGDSISMFPVKENNSKNIAFRGWSFEKDSESDVLEVDYIPSSDCILYAVWGAEEDEEQQFDSELLGDVEAEDPFWNETLQTGGIEAESDNPQDNVDMIQSSDFLADETNDEYSNYINESSIIETENNEKEEPGLTLPEETDTNNRSAENSDMIEALTEGTEADAGPYTEGAGEMENDVHIIESSLENDLNGLTTNITEAEDTSPTSGEEKGVIPESGNKKDAEIPVDHEMPDVSLKDPMLINPGITEIVNMSEQAAGTEASEQDGLEQSFGGNTYQRFDRSMTWTEAKSYCEGLGGHLVTITSQEEQDFVASLVSTGTKYSYWLGAESTSGGFRWVTGEPFAYSNWAPRQPDRHRGEYYLHMFLKPNPHSSSYPYQWNDIQVDNTYYTGGGTDFFSMNYVGFVCEWDISLSKAVITGINNKTYTGERITQNPSVVLNGKKLSLNRDYTLSYKNNIQCGTATVVITGKGNYKGTVSRSFKITKVSIANALITGVFDKVYTGKEIKQTPIVSLGIKLLGLDDYTVSYEDNVYIGTATIIITGKGNYSGTVKKNFRIGRSIVKASVTGIKNHVYTKVVSENGAVQSPTVKLGNTILECNKDYALLYTANKKPGTATVRVSGRGDYVGSVSKTYEIKLATPSFTLESKNHGEVVVTPGNIFGATGYEAVFINNDNNKPE